MLVCESLLPTEKIRIGVQNNTKYSVATRMKNTYIKNERIQNKGKHNPLNRGSIEIQWVPNQPAAERLIGQKRGMKDPRK